MPSARLKSEMPSWAGIVSEFSSVEERLQNAFFGGKPKSVDSDTYIA